jgi:outer membrane immunogenic protein
MQRALASATALVTLAATISLASAADLGRRPPPPPPAPPVYAPLPYFNWTGFYIGINGGGAWGGSSQFDFPGSTSTSFHTSGWLAGGTLGANYQLGHLVLGLEGDIDASDIHGSSACMGGGFLCQTRTDWLGTARGRIGYAFDRFLPYLTGGLAVGHLTASVPGIGSATNTSAGWTVGGGIEVALTGNWSVKAEYLYVDLGSFDCSTCGGVPSTSVEFTTNVVRAGINYRF